MPGGRPKKVDKPKRRKSGTGSIVVDEKTGRAYALDVRDANGYRPTHEGTGTTLEDRRREAEAWLDDRVMRRARAQGLAPETIGQYLQRWLRETYPEGSKTFRTRRSHIEWSRPIADTMIWLATNDDMDQVTDAMLAAGLSNRYCRHVRQTFWMAFQRLVPKTLPENPVGKYRRPLTLPKRRPKCWDEMPTIRFLATARRTRWGPLWTLAATYGPRHHELRGLQWADLNERTGELLVRDKKTHSERVIVLARSVVDELVAWRDSPEAAPHTSSTWMFSARSGHMMGKTTLDDEFPDVIAAANAAIIAEALATGESPIAAERRRLPALTIHGLRHTSATLLLRRGVAVAKVAEILGHHSPAFTYEMYGWAVPSDQAVVDRAIERLLSALPEAPGDEFPGAGQHLGSDQFE